MTMTPPRCTYRVQLHAGLGFDDAARIVDYLDALGVSHLYCSPYLQATAGSTHGYDVVDPQRVSKDLGGADALERLSTTLRASGLRQVLDIVPNHMAVDPANRWWWDVLENGPASRYARFFDIDWEGATEKSMNTVLVPVLGDQYGRAVDAGDVHVERRGGELVVRYFDHVLPLSPRTFDDILVAAARRIDSTPLTRLGEAFHTLPAAHLTDPASMSERHEQKTLLVAALASLCASTGEVATAIDDELVLLHADRDRLDALLRRQNYRLADWRTASEELDYRRFFNIETLVGVRVEDPEVLAATHGLILELVRDGLVHGLRVDHVDGLRDPAEYLTRLAEQSDGVYTVVEKILGPGESLPPWPIAGTSGYEFLIRVNDLFVATDNEASMSRLYETFTGEHASFDDVVHEAKHQVMREDLRSEVERLTVLLAGITDRHRRHRDHLRSNLREALREIVAAFPVYRTYIRSSGSPSEQDLGIVGQAVARARTRRPDLDSELLGFVGELALGAHDGDLEREFALRLQQLTAPVMAKGVEDTAFYRYNRLISLNEVGGNPARFGSGVDAFHRATDRAAAAWPHSMLTLSTHDAKRSADVRARLNVLSEVTAAWGTAVDRWAERNERHRKDRWLDRNAEYLLYQTLVGAWPIDGERVVAFMAKAVKEAKVYTSWTAPVDDYDQSVEGFVRAVVADRVFTDDLERFLVECEIVARGRRNSLAQTTLLLTCPGVPDLYQGSELWDLSLVDPDNRRSVDYELRREILMRTETGDARDALADSESGAPKQWMIRRLLDHRRLEPRCYESSTYEPLPLRGERPGDAIAFAREDLVVVAPAASSGPWDRTTLTLPAGTWTSVLTGEASNGEQSLAALFSEFPVAVLARANS